MQLDARVPRGPLASKWEKHKSELGLISPSNRKNFTIIVVGTGLAGGSAAASLAELGYRVLNFCIQDSPRRAHSVAAQGGINAAKNYQNDGDSVWRLFFDTIKGGDYRSREANVYRLADVANNIIDQCVAQGVPFAREYGGYLANRSFGGAQVSRTFYARGQTGQQLLLGVYGALMRQVDLGGVQLLPRREMLDLVVVDGKARGIVVRNLLTGEIERHLGHAVVLATGGYGNAYYLSTNAMSSNVTAAWRCHRRGAVFANPCFTQIHPTCLPVSGDHQSKLTLMSESLRNDGRVWVPKEQGDLRPPDQIPEEDRDYYLERRYPAFGNLVPRDVASRAAKAACDEGLGVGETRLAVYLDFTDAFQRLGLEVVKERYSNLFELYDRITGEDPYQVPMRIYPAVHYTMGGLWVDYNLMATIPGLYVLGEANFSDHGANRLGASALMQGLADGYFVLPSTIGDYLAGTRFHDVSLQQEEFADTAQEAKTRLSRLLSIDGNQSPTDFHRRLGQILWDQVGMSRNEEGLTSALKQVSELRDEFWQDLKLPGRRDTLNRNVEFAGRVADFLELGELMARDALERRESCGSHFREEYQTADGEAQRDDIHSSHVSAWEFTGDNQEPLLHKEELAFESIALMRRSYK